MKTLRSVPVVVLLFALWLPACSTLEINAARTLGTTAYAVDAAMNGWGDYVRAGKATKPQEESVRQMYLSYQRAMGVAEVAVREYYRAAATTTPPTDASKQQLKQVLRALAAASGDLIMFITEILHGKK